MWRTEQPSKLTEVKAKSVTWNNKTKTKTNIEKEKKKNTLRTPANREEDKRTSCIQQLSKRCESVKLNSVRLHNIRNKKIYYLPVALLLNWCLFRWLTGWLAGLACLVCRLFWLVPIHDCIIYNIFRKSNE